MDFSIKGFKIPPSSTKVTLRKPPVKLFWDQLKQNIEVIPNKEDELQDSSSKLTQRTKIPLKPFTPIITSKDSFISLLNTANVEKTLDKVVMPVLEFNRQLEFLRSFPPIEEDI